MYPKYYNSWHFRFR